MEHVLIGSNFPFECNQSKQINSVMAFCWVH